MRLWITRLLFVCWLLVLTGCGAATTSSPSQPTTAVPTTAPAAPVGTAVSEPAGAIPPLVRYTVMGGIRGADDVLEIYPDRTIKLLRRGQLFREGQVDAIDFATLGVALGSPEFASLSGSYGDLKACCDLMTYSIEMPAMGHVIQTVDGAEQPSSLQAALQQLNNIYIKAQA